MTFNLQITQRHQEKSLMVLIAHTNYFIYLFIYGYCNSLLNVGSVPFLIISSYECINEYVTVWWFLSFTICGGRNKKKYAAHSLLLQMEKDLSPQNAQVASKWGQPQTLLRIQILSACNLFVYYFPQSAVWIFSNVRFSFRVKCCYSANLSRKACLPSQRERERWEGGRGGRGGSLVAKWGCCKTRPLSPN